MVNISAESKPDFMSGFFSLEMLVSAYFATIKSKRLQALQSIFSKAHRVIAMALKNRLQGRFPRAYGCANAPMKPKRHFVGFASRRMAIVERNAQTR